MEFHNYNLPSFGNVAHIQELIFEKAHLQLKKVVSKSNHKKKQLQVMEYALENDWTVRLCIYTVYIYIYHTEVEPHFEEGWPDSAFKSIQRLLVDEEYTRELTEGNRRQVHHALPPPVILPCGQPRIRVVLSSPNIDYGWLFRIVKGW